MDSTIRKEQRKEKEKKGQIPVGPSNHHDWPTKPRHKMWILCEMERKRKEKRKKKNNSSPNPLTPSHACLVWCVWCGYVWGMRSGCGVCVCVWGDGWDGWSRIDGCMDGWTLIRQCLTAPNLKGKTSTSPVWYLLFVSDNRANRAYSYFLLWWCAVW